MEVTCEIRVITHRLEPHFPAIADEWITEANLRLQPRGNCHGSATDRRLTCEICADHPSVAQELSDILDRKLYRRGFDHMSMVRQVPDSNPAYGSKACSPSPHSEANLTKRFFFSLQSGHFLASNLIGSNSGSLFAEEIAAPAERREQWERIKTRGCNNRKCHVFRSEAEYRTWWRDLISRNDQAPR